MGSWGFNKWTCNGLPFSKCEQLARLADVPRDQPGAQSGRFRRAGILHEALPPCTWHTCFEMSRCNRHNLTVYLYQGSNYSMRQDPGTIKWLAHLWRQLHEGATAPPGLERLRLTQQPERACVLLAPLHEVHQIQLTPSWRNGTNHILYHSFHLPNASGASDFTATPPGCTRKSARPTHRALCPRDAPEATRGGHRGPAWRGRAWRAAGSPDASSRDASSRGAPVRTGGRARSAQRPPSRRAVDGVRGAGDGAQRQLGAAGVPRGLRPQVARARCPLTAH